MNKMKWLGMGCLILCLMIGTIHCAGEKSGLKGESADLPRRRSLNLLPRWQRHLQSQWRLPLRLRMRPLSLRRGHSLQANPSDPISLPLLPLLHP